MNNSTNSYKINIAVCGQVSSGKSTAINAILGQYLSETSMKRTTKKIYTFSHSNTKTSIKHIKSEIEKNNTENSTHTDIEFTVNIPFVNAQSLLCSIKDYPGFNDGCEDIDGMEKLFYKDLPQIDYIIYILDATCPLLHKSEKDIVTSIFDKIKQNHQNHKYTRIAFVFNKVDYAEDQEIIDLVNDATQWLKAKMTERQMQGVDNWFLSVSFRKMMLYNINEHGNIRDAPEIILMRMLNEMYGSVHAKKMLCNINSLTIDDLTRDENILFKNLKLFACSTFNSDYIGKVFDTILSSVDIKDYNAILNCINNHYYLKNIDRGAFTNIVMKCIDVMVEYSYDTNNINMLHKPIPFVYSWIKYTSFIFALYIKFVVDGNISTTNVFIQRFYNAYIRDKMNDIDPAVYSYILSKFIDMNIDGWLTKDICDLFVSHYTPMIYEPSSSHCNRLRANPHDGTCPCHCQYQTKNNYGNVINECAQYCKWQVIDNNEITLLPITNINNITDVVNMEKLGDRNPRDMVMRLLPLLDIVLCKSLYGSPWVNTWGKYGPTLPNGREGTVGLVHLTQRYNREKQYSTCARMEKEWIDYKGVDCMFRGALYNDIDAYHNWSKQYIEFPSEPLEQNIGLYPQHVMNFIIYRKLYKQPDSNININNTSDTGDSNDIDEYAMC